jgi:uncharacterized membrane protein YGL010W
VTLQQTDEMNTEYTVVLKQDGEWWIGWIEEVPGVNCQEQSKPALLDSLRRILAEALDFNRKEAVEAAGSHYFEESISV